MLLPVLCLLYPWDDRCGGADAVAGGVPFHHLLAFLGRRPSLGQTRTIRSIRRAHAAPPLIRDRSIASSPARVQPLSATRKATGSFANPAACIRSSHTSCAERSRTSLSAVENWKERFAKRARASLHNSCAHSASHCAASVSGKSSLANPSKESSGSSAWN